jgi:hypothetical protein
MEVTEFRGRVYDQRHGGAFDRGSADSYYGRPRRPHYFEGATYQSKEIVPEPGSKEYQDYMAGYEQNELYGDKKDWG